MQGVVVKSRDIGGFPNLILEAISEFILDDVAMSAIQKGQYFFFLGFADQI